jgi:hypothetical protein
MGLVAGLSPSSLAGRDLRRCGRLGFDRAFAGWRLQAVFEIAESGLQFEDTSFQFPATGTLGSESRGRNAHADNMANTS